MTDLPEALTRDIDRRAQRTVKRVRTAIAALQARGDPVSLRRITAAANAARQPGESRLTESVILRNPVAYRDYCEARPALAPRTRIRIAVREPWLLRMTKDQLMARIQHDRRHIRHLEAALAAACGLVGDSPS